MTWLFSKAMMEDYANSLSSPEQAVAFLEATCLDGGQFAQLNVMPTPQQFWRKDKMIDCLKLSQFGQTLQHLTENHGAELLMSYLADSRARTSAQQAEALGWMGSEADYGEKWHGLFARYSLSQYSWRTPQCSLLGDSDEFSETWPRWGSMRNGASYLRPMPALPICESASGLWQTPVADDAVNRARGKWNSRGEPKLSAQVLNWPTPRARDAQPEGLEAGRRRVEKYSTCSLSTAVNSDAEVATAGLLNPSWVEWLMGWPIGWTDLKPLETAKFHEWQQQHFPSCSEG